MSLVYWLSKFSQEAMLFELLLIGCVCASYFGYLLFQKRKYGVAKKTVPDHVVRAFLVEMISNAEGFKNQLFGENFTVARAASSGTFNTAAATTQAAAAPVGDNSALQGQLNAALAKQNELNGALAALQKEKADLEAKLKAGGAAAGPADEKALAEAKEKISKLESKLSEYEVIEDDLANLKRYQQENKQLKAQLDALQKGGAVAAAAPTPDTPADSAAAPEAPAPETPAAAEAAAAPEPAPAEAPAEAPAAEAPSPLAAAEESVTENKAADSFEGFVDKVEESLAQPEGASATDPSAVEEAHTADAVDENAKAAATEAPKPEKSDADLLNEFERMLSS